MTVNECIELSVVADMASIGGHTITMLQYATLHRLIDNRRHLLRNLINAPLNDTRVWFSKLVAIVAENFQSHQSSWCSSSSE
jgi:hypothetical protein